MIDQPDLEEFEGIYDLTYTKLLKYIVCRCSNMEDVNDILQQSYFELFKAMKKNIAVDNVESYLFKIAKNIINKHYSVLYRFKTLSFFNKSDEELELIDNIESDFDLEEIVLENCDINIIWKYLKKKNNVISKIFYLYYYLGLSIKEIGNELQKSESYIKNSLYRTLKELKIVLREGSD